MPRFAFLLVLACFAGIAAYWFGAERRAERAAGTAPAAAPVQDAYTTGPATPDGTGKFLHGREIAQVMGHQALGWLERDEREQEEAPSRAIAALDLPPAAVIADIGAGSGYYSFRISEKVPLGKVVAVDIQPEMLDFLRGKAEELSVTNVEPHLGAIDDLKLPPATLDAALMVETLYEVEDRQSLLTNVLSALKPGGRLGIVEYRPDGGGPGPGRDQRLPSQQVVRAAEAAGLRFVREEQFLPYQYLLVFTR